MLNGLLPLVGGVLSGGLNLLGGQAQQNSAQQLQQQQEQYNTQMADTQYQRSVADLKAAGLNPMLAYMGSPDPSPQAPGMQYQNIAGGAASAGVSAASNIATAESGSASANVSDAQLNQINANVANTAADTANKVAQLANIRSTNPLLADDDLLKQLQIGLSKTTLNTAQATQKSQVDIGNFWSSHPHLNVGRELLDSILAPASHSAAALSSTGSNTADAINGLMAP